VSEGDRMTPDHDAAPREPDHTGGRSTAGRSRVKRPPESGLWPIVLIDALALLLVVATAPAAWLWIDSSGPGPIVALAGPSQTADQGPALVSSGPSLPATGQLGPSSKPALDDGSWSQAESLPRG